MTTIKPISDPYAADKRLVRKIDGLTVKLVKTSRRGYTAICDELPGFKLPVMGTQPGRIRYEVADKQIAEAITRFRLDKTEEAPVESNRPAFLADMEGLKELEVHGMNYWFDFDTGAFYVEGMADFVGNLEAVLSKAQRSRLERYIDSKKPDLHEPAVGELLAQHVSQSIFRQDDKEEPMTEQQTQTKHDKEVQIGIENIGGMTLLIDFDTPGEALLQKATVTVENWPKYQFTGGVEAGNEEMLDELIENTRMDIKSKLGPVFEGDTVPQIEQITQSAINAEHIGAIEDVYVLKTAVNYIACCKTAGLFDGAAEYSYAHASTMIEAVNELAEQIADRWLAAQAGEDPNDTDTFGLTNEQVLVNEGKLTDEKKEISALHGGPPVEDDTDEDEEPKLEIVDTTQKEDEDEGTEYEYEVPAITPDFNRTYDPIDKLSFMTNDEKPVWMHVQYNRNTREVYEIACKSKFGFIRPEFDEEGDLVFGENGEMVTLPFDYDYTVVVNIESDEYAEVLSTLKVPPTDGKPNAMRTFLNDCFAIFSTEAEEVVRELATAAGKRMEEVKAVGKLQMLAKKAEAGDMKAKMEMQKLIRERQEKALEEQRKKQPLVQSVTADQAKEAGIDVDGTMQTEEGPNRAQRRARRKSRGRRRPMGH